MTANRPIMGKFAWLFLFVYMILNSSIAQENPKIDKNTLLSTAQDVDKVSKELKKADKYYKKEIYEEAVKYYLRLYQYNPNLPSLNYKLGVCCLKSSNQKKALNYLLQSYPETAKDYHYQLGKAFQYNLLYDKAKQAYEDYYQSLKPMQQRSRLNYIQQLKNECDFGLLAVQDSLPVFIINLGPVINSNFDDYAAIVTYVQDTSLFFTSRRPEEETEKVVSRFKFNERILHAVNCLNRPCEEVTEPPLFRTSRHTSVAGYNDSLRQIFYYMGKHENGCIYSAIVGENEFKKARKVKGGINHIAYQESSITAANDSLKHVFFVSDRIQGTGGKDIWTAQKVGKNRYKRVKNLGRQVNSKFDEEALYVEPDGKTLYFSSNGHDGMGGFDIYKTHLQEDGKWSAPVNLGYPINSPSDELFYFPTRDSMLALFSTTRTGGYGGLDIYKIQKDPRIPFVLTGKVTDSKDGRLLPAHLTILSQSDQSIVHSVKQDTLSGEYILSFDDSGRFLIQVDAPGYKSVKDSIIGATIRHDSIEKDFQLDKLKYPFTLHGTITNIRTGMPVEAEILFKPINNDTIILYRSLSHPQTGQYSITFEDKRNMMMEVVATDYHKHSEILGLKRVSYDSEVKDIALNPSKTTYTLTGYIVEADTRDKIPGMVKFFIPGKEQSMVECLTDSVSLRYSISVDQTGPFLLEINSEGFFFLNGSVEFHPDSSLLVRNFELKKMKKGATIVIENILFNSGKTTLKSESFKELNKLANLLIENPDVRIEISGHTDNVGSSAVNKKLSKARALSVKNYLVSRGIEQERIEHEGYGFDNPIAPNNTAEGKAQNRRVEIKVLE